MNSWGCCSVADLGYREGKWNEWLGKRGGVVGKDGGWVVDWIDCVIGRGVGMGEREVEKRMFVVKCYDHLTYCEEYLLWNSEWCSVEGIGAEGKKFERTWLFKVWRVWVI